MKVKVYGQLPNRHRIIKNCVEHTVKLHDMIGGDYRGMNIEVAIHSDMEGNGALLVNESECQPDSEPPSSFVIHIKKQTPFIRVLLSLCHELVHVMQFRKGHAYYLSDGTLTYGGVVINPAEYDNPMEWAAFGRERFLTQNFCLAYSLCHQDWYDCPFSL